MIDPGPRVSVTFTIIVTPKTEPKEDLTAKVEALVTNFYAKLQLADGTQAPANKNCTFALGLLADSDGESKDAGDTGSESDQTGQTA